MEGLQSKEIFTQTSSISLPFFINGAMKRNPLARIIKTHNKLAQRLLAPPLSLRELSKYGLSFTERATARACAHPRHQCDRHSCLPQPQPPFRNYVLTSSHPLICIKCTPVLRVPASLWSKPLPPLGCERRHREVPAGAPRK